MTSSWRKRIAVHPAADLFPTLTETELDELARDIEQHGLTTPLALWRPNEAAPYQLLDGRNRVAAMARLVDGEDRIEGAISLANRYEARDPVAFVVSANIRRRHLNNEQKRDLVAKLLKQNPERSNRAVAGLARVSDHTVANVRSGLVDGAQIAHHASRVGKDGVAQPATKPAPASQRYPGTPREAIRAMPLPRPESVEEWRRRIREDQYVVEPTKAAEPMSAHFATLAALLLRLARPAGGDAARRDARTAAPPRAEVRRNTRCHRREPRPVYQLGG
jgi:hypothetical protein